MAQGGQIVEDAAHRPYVNFLIVVPVQQELRGEVGRRAHTFLLVVGGDVPGKPQVCELEVLLEIEEDVFDLDISMHDVALVEEGNNLQQLQIHAEEFALEPEGALLLLEGDESREVASLDQLEHHVEVVVADEGLEQSHYPPVVHLAQETHFPVHLDFLAFREVGDVDFLEGEEVAGADMADLVDDCSGSSSDHGDDLVVPQPSYLALFICHKTGLLLTLFAVMKAESKTKLSPIRRPSSRHDSHYYSEASSTRPIATSRSRVSVHPTERTPRRKSQRARMHQETGQFLSKYFGEREEVEEGQFIEAFSNEYSELWEHQPQICEDLLNLLGRTLFQSKYLDRQKLSNLSREGGMLGLVMDLLKQLDLDCDPPQIKNLKNVVQEYLESMYNKIQIKLQNHFNNEMRRTVLRLKQAQSLLRKVDDRIREGSLEVKSETSAELREERRLGEALQEENEKLLRQNRKMSQTIQKFQAVIQKQKQKKERNADRADKRVAFATTPLKQPLLKDKLESHWSKHDFGETAAGLTSQEPKQNSYKVIQTSSRMHLLKTPVGRTQQHALDYSAPKLPFQQYHAKPFNFQQKQSPLPTHMIATFDRPGPQPCHCPAGCLNDCVKKFIRGLLNEADEQGLSCRVKVSQVGIR